MPREEGDITKLASRTPRVKGSSVRHSVVSICGILVGEKAGQGPGVVGLLEQSPLPTNW